MSILKINEKLPMNFGDIIVEGLSGGFSDELYFILKSDEWTLLEIETFNSSSITIDVLKLDFFNTFIGNLYPLSIKIDGLIDNSEIYFDFINENLISYLKSNSRVSFKFILVDENDKVLAFRDFILPERFVKTLLKEPCNIDNYIFTKNYMSYIQEAFVKIFENEPEENLRLYRIETVTL